MEREALEFVVLAFAPTFVLHGLLAASGESFSLESPTTAALYLPGLLAPSAAAVVIERVHRGRDGVRALLDGVRPRHVRSPRLVGAVAAPIALTGSALVLASASSAISFDAVLAVGQLWVVVGEEIGWRGWLWPRAVDHLGAVGGTVLVTVVWGLWHLPMFAVAASFQAEDGVLAFAAAIAAWGTIHGVLQLGAPSIVTAMVFHAMANITASTVDVTSRPALVATYAVGAALALGWLALRANVRSEVPETGT